jgi:hypothetical protein
MQYNTYTAYNSPNFVLSVNVCVRPLLFFYFYFRVGGSRNPLSPPAASSKAYNVFQTWLTIYHRLVIISISHDFHIYQWETC